jgi:hypothetical protein
MQSRSIRQLARRIRQKRQKKHPDTWIAICNDLSILKQDGTPDPALAFMIGMRGFMPKRPATLERLGIPARKPRQSVKDLPPHWMWWRNNLHSDDREKRVLKLYLEENHER